MTDLKPEPEPVENDEVVEPTTTATTEDDASTSEHGEDD